MGGTGFRGLVWDWAPKGIRWRSHVGQLKIAFPPPARGALSLGFCGVSRPSARIEPGIRTHPRRIGPPRPRGNEVLNWPTYRTPFGAHSHTRPPGTPVGEKRRDRGILGSCARILDGFRIRKAGHQHMIPDCTPTQRWPVLGPHVRTPARIDLESSRRI